MTTRPPTPRYDGDPTKLARWRSHAAAPPGIAVWEITLRCDLGCRHCGSRAGRARSHELTTDEALALVADLADLGVKEVALIGGEFYMREDWERIAAAISRSGMLCSVVTGARQLTAARVRRAAAAGVGKISLSIDGLEATHDALRGSKGAWQAAIEAAALVRGQGIDLSVNSQMNRLSMPELPALADLLAQIGARSWMVILTAPLGRAADRPDLMLQPYHLLYLFPLLATIKRDRLEPAGIALFPGNNVGYFSPFDEQLQYGGQHGWDGCAAGEAALGIEADGSLKGCPSLPSADYVRGNVTTEPLVSLWWRLRAEKAERPTVPWGFCGTCPHAARCRGGCTWTTHAIFGRPGNNPFCHSRAIAMATRGIAETLEREVPAPGLPFDFGRYRLVERDLEATVAADPVIAATLAARGDGPSAWSAAEITKMLALNPPRADNP